MSENMSNLFKVIYNTVFIPNMHTTPRLPSCLRNKDAVRDDHCKCCPLFFPAPLVISRLRICKRPPRIKGKVRTSEGP